MGNTLITALDAISTQRYTKLGHLLLDYSLEMNARDAPQIVGATSVPAATAISITSLPNDNDAVRISAAATLRQCGFEPVPHLAARRLKSVAVTDALIGNFVEQAQVRRVFVIAGDMPEAGGPYADALALIRSGVLERHGVNQVSISGYPEGHPNISDSILWTALQDKCDALRDQSASVEIMTQFGFDADPILDWLTRLRDKGITVPVRVGIAGPTTVKSLLRFATLCGVGTSARVLRKYGISITRLLGTAGPEPVLSALVEGLDSHVHGDVKLHFYPFGGFTKTANWVPAYLEAQLDL
jgi:methylenetetrahydrofolate reductase (NADPH)